MVPKVEGAWDIHYVDQLLAQLEANAGLERPILVIHAILETALGVANVEEICAASPRMQGLSLGPADLAASAAHEDDARRRRPSRATWCAPTPIPRTTNAPRATAQQDLWHYTMARMVDACTANGILPVLRPLRRHQGHGRPARTSSATPS